MMHFIYSLLGILLPIVNSYTSMSGGGNFVKSRYISDPENDLYKITPSQASTISKSWVDILSSSIPPISLIGNDNLDYRKYRIDSYAHLYDGINDFERYLNNHRSENDLYLSWQPRKSKQKTPETLFIVAAEIEPVSRNFKINQILQSPGWLGSRDIPSLELKKALEYVNEKANCTKIDYTPMRETSLRFYWSWFPPGVASKVK